MRSAPLALASLLAVSPLAQTAAEENSPRGHPGNVAPTSGTDSPAASEAKL